MPELVDSVIELYGNYLRLELHLAETTIYSYMHEVRLFGSFLKARGLDFKTLNRADVLDFIIEQRRKQDLISGRTLLRVFSTLNSLFSYLDYSDIRSSNPILLLERPKQINSLPQTLTVAELDALLATFNITSKTGLRDRALFELIYSCGLRVSEAVDLTLSRLYLPDSVILIQGKGEKQRLVPLGEEALYWLQRYLLESRPLLLQKNSLSDSVFLNFRGAKLSRKGMWKRFKEAATEVGVSSKIHNLRHSFASHLLQGGADLRSIQEILGHADMTTTQLYTHLAVADQEKNHKLYHPRA